MSFAAVLESSLVQTITSLLNEAVLHTRVMNPKWTNPRYTGPSHNITKSTKVGQSKAKDVNGDYTVLWYKHPRMGYRVIDHPGTSGDLTHAEWMHQEGITNHEFDKVPRGRFHYRSPWSAQKTPIVDEVLHTGHTTPDHVHNYIKRNYKDMGKHLFTDNHRQHQSGPSDFKAR